MIEPVVVSSSNNPSIKHLVALASSAKTRRETSETILEGVHIVRDGMASGQVIRQLVVAESSLGHDEVMEIMRRRDEALTELLIVSDARFRSFSVVEHGVGVAAIMVQPSVGGDIVLDSDAILLDGVQDPGNVGTILRTAAAAGVRRVYCSPDTASAWAPKVLRAGMGAQFSLEVYESVDLVGLIAEATIPVYATLLSREAVSLYELALDAPAAWLFGSEGRGVREGLVAAGAKPVFIPQTDGVESLNVSAAAAICLFEQRRQRVQNI